MLLARLLADKAEGPVCFGPLCSALTQTPTGTAGNPSILISFARTLSGIINLFLVVGGLLLLLYLMWGALDWIMSEGDKEKLQKAQHKITQALIGMILVVAVLTIYGLVAGDILGIVIKNPDGSWSFRLPVLTSP